LVKGKELFRTATEKEYGRKFTDAELEAYVILAQSGVHIMSAACRDPRLSEGCQELQHERRRQR
jgi:hypothetical protein